MYFLVQKGLSMFLFLIDSPFQSNLFHVKQKGSIFFCQKNKHVLHIVVKKKAHGTVFCCFFRLKFLLKG